MGRTLVDYSPETEAFEQQALESDETPWSGERSARGVFGEVDEMELAARLLEVTSEVELEHFLGNLIRSAGHFVGSVVSIPTAQALGGILKSAAKQALPAFGRALGSHRGGATAGDAGMRAAQAAGRYFGLELEGLSPEDQEFEAAKSFVRFAGESLKNAAAARAGPSPQAAAQAAAAQAARRYAPGLLRNVPDSGSADWDAQLTPTRRGRWVRRGRNITVVNC